MFSGIRRYLTLRKLQKKIGENAEAHGWNDLDCSFGDRIALAHSELSEALEEYRVNDNPIHFYYRKDGKPEGVRYEFADVVIRLFHIADDYGFDLLEAILEKHEFNKTRPHLHGGKTY